MKILFCALALAASASSAAASCLDFDSTPAGTAQGVGPVVALPDGNVSLRRFFWLGGGSTVAGVATVVASNWAAGSAPHELNLNNINLRVDVITAAATTTATFNYADFGGNVNLRVNGVLANVNDLSGVPAFLGGAAVAVTRINMFGYHFGTVMITGALTDFAVGGQEFYVDDVCW
jgi:hypothetical protein